MAHPYQQWENALKFMSEAQEDVKELVSKWKEMLNTTPHCVEFHFFDGSMYSIPNFAMMQQKMTVASVDAEPDTLVMRDSSCGITVGNINGATLTTTEVSGENWVYNKRSSDILKSINIVQITKQISIINDCDLPTSPNDDLLYLYCANGIVFSGWVKANLPDFAAAIAMHLKAGVGYTGHTQASIQGWPKSDSVGWLSFVGTWYSINDNPNEDVRQLFSDNTTVTVTFTYLTHHITSLT